MLQWGSLAACLPAAAPCGGRPKRVHQLALAHATFILLVTARAAFTPSVYVFYENETRSACLLIRQETIATPPILRNLFVELLFAAPAFPPNNGYARCRPHRNVKLTLYRLKSTKR